MARYEIDNQPWPINMEEHDAVQRTIQNCKNLIRCRVGDVPYDRARGIDTRFLTQPIDLVRNGLKKELERVLMWESNAKLIDAECTLDENGEIFIKMVVDIEGEAGD